MACWKAKRKKRSSGYFVKMSDFLELEIVTLLSKRQKIKDFFSFYPPFFFCLWCNLTVNITRSVAKFGVNGFNKLFTMQNRLMYWIENIFRHVKKAEGIKVLLLENMPNLGVKGIAVTVKRGYMRNFLVKVDRFIASTQEGLQSIIMKKMNLFIMIKQKKRIKSNF